MLYLLGLLFLTNVYLCVNGQNGQPQVTTTPMTAQGQIPTQGSVITQNPATGQLQTTPMTTQGVMNPNQGPVVTQNPATGQLQTTPVTTQGVMNPNQGTMTTTPLQQQPMNPGMQYPMNNGVVPGMQYPTNNGVVPGMQYPMNNGISPGMQYPMNNGIVPAAQTPMNNGMVQYPQTGQYPMQQPPVGYPYPSNSNYPAGLQLNTPESRLGYQWMATQLSHMLNDPHSRESLILLFTYLPGILSNPRFPGMLQAFNDRLNRIANNPQKYNDYINGYEVQPTSTVMHTVGGPQGGGIWDTIMKKKNVIGKTIGRTVQTWANGAEELLGDVPFVGQLTRTGTGILGNTYTMLSDPILRLAGGGRVDSMPMNTGNTGTMSTTGYPTVQQTQPYVQNQALF